MSNASFQDFLLFFFIFQTHFTHLNRQTAMVNEREVNYGLSKTERRYNSRVFHGKQELLLKIKQRQRLKRLGDAPEGVEHHIHLEGDPMTDAL